MIYTIINIVTFFFNLITNRHISVRNRPNRSPKSIDRLEEERKKKKENFDFRS